MTLAMWRELAKGVQQLDARDDIAAVVIRGAGQYAFCAGADVSEFQSVRHNARAIAAYDRAIAAAEDAIATTRVPTIAMMHGICAGGGAAIALACDLRFAGEDLRFSIPAAKLRAVYPASTVTRLVRIAGRGAALDVLASARIVDGREALALRLVDRMVASDGLESFVLGYATALGRHASLSIRAALLAVRAAEDPSNVRIRAELRQVQR
jgi:enoyl-CoA hydratase/carnithine racemase